MYNIEKEVKEIVAKISKIPEDKLSNDANLFSDLGVDSLLGVEIFAALDKKYSFDIPENKLRNVHTIGDLIALVRGLKE